MKLFGTMKLFSECIMFRSVLLLLIVIGCGGNGVDQSTITFAIENSLTESRYFTRSVACEFEREGNWEPCHFSKPFCMEQCDGRDCAICGLPAPSVRVLQAGGSHQQIWEGLLHHVTGDNICPCYTEKQPAAGRYRGRVCVYDAWTCEIEPCEQKDGMILGASLSGNRTCYESEFEIPYQQDRLTIRIE